MRTCPQWFQDALTSIGGRNPYGEPIFKLVWSTEPKHVIGGYWSRDGQSGYREVRSVSGAECWVLMVWEPKETQGSPARWEWEFRDPQSGLLECGPYPHAGRYRVLKRFMHQELVSQPYERHYLFNGEPRIEVLAEKRVVTYRLEPSGVILDILLPMLMAWRRLNDVAKMTALKQDEQDRKDEFLAKAKDARAGCRVMRGSELVRKRAEVIEKGLADAMRAATKMGLGMRLTA